MRPQPVGLDRADVVAGVRIDQRLETVERGIEHRRSLPCRLEGGFDLVDQREVLATDCRGVRAVVAVKRPYFSRDGCKRLQVVDERNRDRIEGEIGVEVGVLVEPAFSTLGCDLAGDLDEIDGDQPSLRLYWAIHQRTLLAFETLAAASIVPRHPDRPRTCSVSRVEDCSSRELEKRFH